MNRTTPSSIRRNIFHYLTMSSLPSSGCYTLRIFSCNNILIMDYRHSYYRTSISADSSDHPNKPHTQTSTTAAAAKQQQQQQQQHSYWHCLIINHYNNATVDVKSLDMEM